MSAFERLAAEGRALRALHGVRARARGAGGATGDPPPAGGAAVLEPKPAKVPKAKPAPGHVSPDGTHATEALRSLTIGQRRTGLDRKSYLRKVVEHMHSTYPGCPKFTGAPSAPRVAAHFGHHQQGHAPLMDGAHAMALKHSRIH